MAILHTAMLRQRTGCRQGAAGRGSPLLGAVAGPLDPEAQPELRACVVALHDVEHLDDEVGVVAVGIPPLLGELGEELLA